MSRYQIQVSARTVEWPAQCACCNGPAETTLRASTTRTTSRRLVTTIKRHWDVPYCEVCLAHIQKHRSAVSMRKAGIGVALVAGFLATFSTEYGLAIGILAALLLAGSISRSRALEQQAVGMTKPGECVSTAAAVEYLEWYGILHTFVFANAEYLEAFLEANGQHPDIRQVR